MTQDHPPPLPNKEHFFKVVFMPNSFSLNKPNKNNSNPRVINLQKLYIHVLHSTSLRLQY